MAHTPKVFTIWPLRKFSDLNPRGRTTLDVLPKLKNKSEQDPQGILQSESSEIRNA